MNKPVCLVSCSDFSLSRPDLVKALSILGMKVTVVTNEPVYISKREPRSLLHDNKVQIVSIKIPFTKVLYQSIMGRLIFYITFMILSFFKLFKIDTRPTILFSTGPHPFTEISCIFYKKFFGYVKIVSDISDLWPDSLEYVNMNRALKHILITIGHSINYLIYSKIDAIDAVVTLNEAMRKVLRQRIKQNIYIIYGAIDLTKFKPMRKEDALAVLPKEIANKVNGKFVVLYAGMMGVFQNPLIVIDVAKKIRNECEDLVFVVVGAGPLKQILQKKIKEESLDNVIVFDAVSRELMPFIYNISDLALLPPPVLSIPRIRRFFIFTLPRKFMEYAACGKPILCITPLCVASNLCLKWKAGYHVEPDGVENVINVIKTFKENKTLREKLEENARKMAEKLFSVERAVETLSQIIEAL